MPATCSMPPLMGNRPPPRAWGGSKSAGATSSRSRPRAVSIRRSSVNVRASSTSPPRSGEMASRFLAMHGPMNTTRMASPWSARSSRAIAIIGDTMGASDPVRSGWYRRT